MAIINNVNEVLHRIRVKLYPNYLPKVEGAYIARTDTEASLSIEEVCAALKNRGGFTGNYDDLVEHVHQFFDEAAYQICDGFAVSTGYFSVHPNVGGTFESVNDSHDSSKHPITFRFHVLSALRALAAHIAVDVTGLADIQAYIDNFIDVATESIKETITPGGQFIIEGHKIKIAGDDADNGIYFVSATDASARVKVSGHFAENISSRIIGIIPALNAGQWKVEIRTQFSNSSTTLKNPRVIESRFPLTVE
ncbi:hypothetical protein PilKf_01038 [Pillotina sp. SPG140]|jgi:hypothetical protein